MTSAKRTGRLGGHIGRLGGHIGPPLLALAMLISMLVAPAAAAEVGELEFRNTSGGGDIISLTDARDYEAVLTLDGEVPPESVTWSLSRAKGEQDERIFPYQYLGGPLADWNMWDSDSAYFTDIQTTAVTEDGKPALKLTFSSELFFGVNRMDAPRANRNAILDYTGDFVLACADADGKTLGQATIRVNPYDDYKTNSELAASLAEAKAASSGVDGLYIDLQSMGVSTQGRDMPYVVISDSKASVDSYLSLTEQALRDPAGVLARVKSGSVDFRVPVLFSNIHPDETPGADAPMNLVWDIVNSFGNGGKITYKTLTGFTPEGEAQLKAELDAAGIQWSGLISDYVTGLGFITDGNEGSGKVDLEKYYTVADVTLDVNELLDNVILIICPTENVDGRTSDIRQNGNGFDINRDNIFQTQAETRNMTQLIAKWNPATMVELHGFVSGYQVEPCSPPHEPNFEYDLFAELGLKSGEAFGIGAIANNDTYNSYVMPLRDYLVTDGNGDPYWEYPWDDMSTNYTPQYSMLHGSVAFTIEVPAANQAGTTSLEYGLINHAKFVMDNKAAFYENQLTGWSRGVNNIDEPAIADWYVDMHDNLGAEKDVYRPKYDGNGNFFPEYYIIPLDAESQHNPAAAYDMQEFLLRNGVRMHALNEDVTIGGVLHKAGSVVVSMYQAKRNVANGALYDGVLITGWTDLYSEPVTAFGKMRGFDCYAIDVKGAVPDSALTEIVSAQDTAVYFNGIEGSEVIIDNDSVEAIALANAMLTDGAKVGFVTQGEYIADFVVSYDTYLQYRDGFVVKATGVESAPDAKLLRPAPIYIPGFAGDFSMDSSGKPYGAFNFPNYGNTNYNFDRFAYGTQMGFEIVGDPASALMIVGNRALDGGAIEEVKAGKPYLAAGAGALATVKSELLGQYGFDYTANNPIQDALYFVSFGGGSLTTAGYERRGDNLLYSYGGAYISGVPADADVLLTATDDTPLEGFMIQEDLDEYLGAVQAIAYTSNGLDVTVFAGSLTNKAHQQDDYQYAANTIFAKTMYGDYSASVFDDIDGHSDYDAIMYVYSNSLLVGTGAKKFSPDLAMNRAMAVTVLGRAAGVDVSEYAGGAYYAPYANWAAQSDIIAVADGGLFAPDASVTRQELAVVLLRYMDFMGDEYVVTEEYILFADEGDIADYAKSAVQIIYKLGLIDAADNNFAPNAAVTRAQMASILQRYLSD